MLGPNKWILFTIVGGVLLSIHIHAIDAPAKSLISPAVQSFTNQKLGITVENFQNFAAISSRRQSRNLVPPYQEFSNRDRVQFIDSRTRNSRNLPGTFGSFRIEIPSTSVPNFRRRSDEYDDTVGTFPAGQQQQSYDISYDFDYPSDDNGTFGLLSSNYQPFQNKVIPISFSRATEGQSTLPSTTSTLKNNVKLADDESKSAEMSSTSSTSSTSSSTASKESEERSSRMVDETAENESNDDKSDKVRFPDESLPQPEALTARRSGLQFEQSTESEMKQQQTYNPFIPQSYSEESYHFGDTIPHFQRPYNEETLESSNENERISMGNRYYRPFIQPIQPFRDEVTKFGDINGPITAFNRPIREFMDSAASTLLSFPRTSQFDSIPSIGYFESSRPPRHYFPAKAYTEYAPDYAAPKYLQPSYTWKQTRQPRVVFPPPNDFAQGTVGTTYVGNDNIVFR